MNTNDLWKSWSHSLYNTVFELIEKSLSLRTAEIIVRFDEICRLIEGKTIRLTFGCWQNSVNVVFDIKAKLP